MNLATVAIGIAMMMDGTGAGPEPPTPDEQFRALRDAHQMAFDAFVKANGEAKTPEEEAKVLNHPGCNFGYFGKVDMYKDVYGADWADRLRRLDPEALDHEAELLFERVAKYYADVPHNDKRRNPGPLSDAALAYLRERRELAVGKSAPEIEGVDLDGQIFRLADYRGKVVVLDFGSHFYCGACRAIYPHMRALNKRIDGRRFALISINSEPEKDVNELRDAWTSQGNTWRCLFDGTWEGPIQKAWNIQFFPTIYVLDSKGVIRHKDLRERELDDAVETLLRETEATK
jgi:thiol-disulfide isomerase/thioredoxin